MSVLRFVNILADGYAEISKMVTLSAFVCCTCCKMCGSIAVFVFILVCKWIA